MSVRLVVLRTSLYHPPQAPFRIGPRHSTVWRSSNTTQRSLSQYHGLIKQCIRSSPRPSTHQSAIGNSAIIFIGSIGLTTGSLLFYSQSNKPARDPLEPETDKEAEKYQIMVKEPLPGRPGNLTADQEAKLKELWKLTLRVFGVSAESLGLSGELDEEGLEEEESSSVASPEKKKKRKGFFRRKARSEKGKEDGAKEVDGIHIKAGDTDDKYGQTKEFQKALADNPPEDLRKAFWSMVKHDHPDGLLLRFLRARKWDVEKALVMLISTMQWRAKEMHVDDDIILKGEGHALAESKSSNAAEKKEGEDFLAQLRLGKSFLHGTDKEGRPMCFVRARLHRQGEQSEPSLERYTVYTIETARLLLSPPVDTAVSNPSDPWLSS